MRFFFFILSVTTMLSATQPIWDAACKALASNCGATLCEQPTCTPEEENQPVENPMRQCCPSFQCCFVAFGAFSTPYQLIFNDLYFSKNKPSEKVKALHSIFIEEYFDPPDAAFFS